MQCLNLNNKEVKAALDELTAVLGSYDAAYYVISENNGYAIDQAPNGAQSKLFSDLLAHYNGDRAKAIQAKAKVFTDSFRNQFGDWLQRYKYTTKISDLISTDVNGKTALSWDIYNQILDDYFSKVDDKVFVKGRETLSTRVENHFPGEGHTIDHIRRVTESMINAIEGAYNVDIPLLSEASSSLQNQRQLLILAAMFHDAAKPYHHGDIHGWESADILRDILKNSTGYDLRLAEWAVRHHMPNPFSHAGKFTIREAELMARDALRLGIDKNTAINAFMLINAADIINGRQLSDEDKWANRSGYEDPTIKGALNKELPEKKALLEQAFENVKDYNPGNTVDNWNKQIRFDYITYPEGSANMPWLYNSENDSISDNIDYNGEPIINKVVDSVKYQKIDQVNKRRKQFTAEEWQLSDRLSNMLRTLFPEISLKYVESLENGAVGQIDLDALEALIDASESGLDTIPHEYAHYYVAMFRDSNLVKEGIKEFGSEEALVQAIGERTVKVEGKVRKWWQKLFDYIKQMLNKNKYAKQILLAELTDSFLNRREISNKSDISGVRYQQQQPTIEEVRNIIKNMANSVVFDEQSHTYTDKATGKVLTSVTKWKEKFNYDNYDAAAEDAVQATISDEARTNGTDIHALLEALLTNNFDAKNFPRFSNDAIKGAIEIVNKIKKNYDFVASEATLADAEHGIAGTADLIMRDKTTGEYVIFDYKTKMYKYNGKSKNKKGKTLYGFIFVNSKKFNIKSARDGYDFQLSSYQKILEGKGIKISRRGIIPLLYNQDGDKLTKLFRSSIFGNDEQANDKLIKEGFFEIIKQKQTEYDVDFRIFGDKSSITGSESMSKDMLDELTSIINKISKKLEIQKELFRIKGLHVPQKEAEQLYEKIQNLTELDGLLKYVNYAVDQLERLNKQVERLYKEGDNAKWSLSELQNYKDVATAYSMIDEITGIAHRYQNIFGKENVAEIDRACNKLQSLQRNIISAYNSIGSKLYISVIAPYIGNVRNQMQQEERKKYIEKNPKKSSENDKQFEQRVSDHIAKWTEENAELINNRTTTWLRMQSQIADNNFECSSMMANLQSVYESRDPFVQAMVLMFDEKMNHKDRKLIEFKTKLRRILDEYRNKYGVGNFSNLKEAFADLIDISEDGVAFLVNEYGSEYIQAEKAAHRTINTNQDLTFAEKQKAFKEWLDQNCPITDVKAFQDYFDTAVEQYLDTVDEKYAKEIRTNNESKEPKSFYQLYKEGKIPYTVREALETIEKQSEQLFRHPNPSKYPNTKYQNIMKLKESNDPKYKLWELLSGIMNDMDKAMPYSLRLNSRLPGIIRRGAERVGSDGVVQAVKANVQQNSIIMEDDSIRGTFVNEDGKKINQIPMYYFYNSKININEQSFDLPTIFYKWYDAALTYQAKRSIETYVLQTQALLHGRETIDKTYALTDKSKKTMTSSHKTGTSKQYDAWVDQVFYNNRVQDLGSFKLPFSEKRVDLAKLIKTIISMASKRTMFGNAISALNNVLVGETNQAEEVLAKEFVSPKSYTKASKIFAANIAGITADVNKVSPDNKINKLADWFGIYETNSNMSLRGFMRHSVNDYGYFLNRAGDVALKYRMMLAFLIEEKARDKDGNILGDMLDFIDFDENNQLTVDDKVANFEVKQQDKLSIKLRRVLMGLHGNYDTVRAAVAMESKWYGWAGLSLRRWIEPNFERRFNQEHYSNLTDSMRSGYLGGTIGWLFYRNPVMTSVINFIAVNVFRAKEFKLEALHWKDLPKAKKMNLIRGIVEFGVAALAFLLYMTLEPDDDDNEPQSDLIANIRYQAYRLFTDMTFFLLPTSFAKILNDPFPVTGFLIDITNVFVQAFKPFEEYQRGEHLFDNKLLNQMSSLIPGIKQIGRFSNVATEMELFTRQR